MPWPPSVGVYFRICKGRFVKTQRARDYLKEVQWIVRKQKIESFGDKKIFVSIAAYPPDARKRDLDNLLKVSMDSLEVAKVFNNDNQIQKYDIERYQKVKSGRLLVSIAEYNNSELEKYYKYCSNRIKID